MRNALRFVAWCLVVSQVAILGCRDSWTLGRHGGSSASGSSSQFNLGEVVYRVVRGRLSVSPDNPQAKVAILDANHDPFVQAINATVPGATLGGLLQSVGSFLPLVDDGTIPGMTDDIAVILDRLAGDPQTLGALADLSSTRSVIATEDLVALVGRMIQYPATADIFTGVADIVRANDGVDDFGVPNGEPNLLDDALRLASVKLSTLTLSGTASQNAILVGDLLLQSSQPRSSANLGEPAWAVRIDLHGNPRVAMNPQTGTIYPPFVDLDADGAADVDAAGAPVDVMGNSIDIPAFTDPWATAANGIQRDGFGRALLPGGTLLYDYFDAKETCLGMFLMVAGELVRRGALSNGAIVADAVLGAPATSDAGTPFDPSDDYLAYPDRNPLTDLAWGGAELLRDPSVVRAVEALSVLATSDPRRTEMVLVAAGKAIEALRTANLQQADVRRLLDEFLPLLDALFEVRGGISTGRLLLDVVSGLGQTALDLPGEFAELFRYRKMVRGAGGPGTIDTTRSELVDYAMPRYYYDAAGTLVDNRSLFEQQVQLMVTTDGCPVPFTNKTMAELTIELMAGLSPQSVDTLVQLLSTYFAGLANLFCPGIGQDLDSLDALATSGALDAFLPIARAFRDRNEIRTLLDMYHVVERNMQTIRTLLPTVLRIFDSGAVEAIIEATQISTQVALPGTQDVVADALADATTVLVDDDAPRTDRYGQPVRSALYLLLTPLYEANDRAAAVPAASQAYSDLAFGLGELLVQRVTNDAGTPLNPADDFEELANPGLVPFLARALDRLHTQIPADQASRNTWVADLQALAAETMTGRELPLAMDIARTIATSAARAQIEGGVANLLLPGATAQQDPFGALVKIAAMVLQQRVNATALEQVLRFVGAVIDPAQGFVRHLVLGVAAIVRRDTGQAILAILRNALDQTILGTGESPVETLLRVAREILNAGGVSGALSAATIEGLLRDAVAFIQADPGGLEEIYRIIQSRRTP